MKILALDSSGIVASVAVVEDDTLLAEYTVNYKKTHSQTLLPMLDEIGTGIRRCYCSGSGTGILYRTPYRLGNSQRPGTCPEETIGSSTDSRCTGI